MKNHKLAQIYSQYEEIIHSPLSEYELNRQLLRLLADMETHFHILSIHSGTREPRHRSIYALYRMISNSRTQIIHQAIHE